MANLFKIEFVQGKTDAADYGQVVHSLEDSASIRHIHKLRLSPHKVASVSNYRREPRRCEWQCFVDDWIAEYILSGDYEHERHICHYEVRIWRDSEVVFTGIIDTSAISYNVASQVIQFTCYDKQRLFTIYSDLTHWYGVSAGYYPYMIVSHFISDVQSKIPIAIPFTSSFVLPEMIIPAGAMRMFKEINYQDIATLPANTTTWAFSWDASSWSWPKWGYRVNVAANQIRFVFGLVKVVKAQTVPPAGAATKYSGRYMAVVIRIFNQISTVEDVYEYRSDWKDSVGDLVEHYSDFIAHLQKYGIDDDVLNSGLSGAITYNGTNYNSSHSVGQYVRAQFAGNIFPPRIHPGQGYVRYEPTQENSLKVLQAMLMMYNATLYCRPDGALVLQNKASGAAIPISISDDDVLLMNVRRQDSETPDIESLAVLAGDTTVLQELVKDYLMSLSSRWQTEMRIADLSTAVGILSVITVHGDNYLVTDIDRDFNSDVAVVNGWRI